MPFMFHAIFNPENWALVPFHFWSLCFFALGCIVGSFLNVCIYRMPLGLSIVSPPSHCHSRLSWAYQSPQPRRSCSPSRTSSSSSRRRNIAPATPSCGRSHDRASTTRIPSAGMARRATALTYAEKMPRRPATTHRAPRNRRQILIASNRSPGGCSNLRAYSY